jgi:membrane protease YdiL (CAAX protease family)
VAATALTPRLVGGYVVLAAVWAVAFNATGLAFFPVVVAGALVTGAVGWWVRAALPANRRPGFRLTPAHAGLAVGVAVVHVVSSHLLFAVGSALVPLIGESGREVYQRTSEAPFVLQLLLSGLVVAPLEEVFWRGAFQPAVGGPAVRHWPTPPRTAVVVAVSTAGYTVFHVATLRLSLVAAAALGGLLWAWLLEHTRSLGATILAHALWTALLVVFPVV